MKKLKIVIQADVVFSQEDLDEAESVIKEMGKAKVLESLKEQLHEELERELGMTNIFISLEEEEA